MLIDNALAISLWPCSSVHRSIRLLNDLKVHENGCVVCCVLGQPCCSALKLLDMLLQDPEDMSFKRCLREMLLYPSSNSIKTEWGDGRRCRKNDTLMSWVSINGLRTRNL